MEESVANIKSAKKRIRVIEKKTQRNRRVKSRLKEILKDLEAAVANRDKETARDKLALAEKKLMQAAAKGTLHKNTASRKVARITAAFKSAFGQDALLEKANKPEAPLKSKEKKASKPEAVADVAEGDAVEEAAEKKPAARKRSTKKESVEEAETSAVEETDAIETEEAAPAEAQDEAETAEAAEADESSQS
jgi:small subunit ribosomal protein S20